MKLYVDGGCRPNPGTMAVAVTDKNGNILVKKLLWEGTNNEAEYLAVLEALRYAKQNNINEVTILTDSQLVERQLNGFWSINEEHLQSYWKRVKLYMEKFKTVEINKIPRNKNPAGKILEKLWRGD